MVLLSIVVKWIVVKWRVFWLRKVFIVLNVMQLENIHAVCHKAAFDNTKFESKIIVDWFLDFANFGVRFWDPCSLECYQTYSSIPVFICCLVCNVLISKTSNPDDLLEDRYLSKLVAEKDLEHCADQPTSANWRKLCFFDLSSPNWSPANWRISASWKLCPRVIETWPPHFTFSNLGGLPASLCVPLSKL